MEHLLARLLCVLPITITLAVPVPCFSQVRVSPGTAIAPQTIRNPIRVGPNFIVLVPSIKVINAASGTPGQMSLVWEVGSSSNGALSVQVSVNGKQVYSNPQMPLVASASGGWDTGPQTIALSSLATIGGALTYGLNTAHVDVTQVGALAARGADATFALPGLWASANAPVPEQPLSLSWRWVELIPQNPPDPSTISVTVTLAGQTIFPVGGATGQWSNCYANYFPDSTNKLVSGWYADCGLQGLPIPAVDPLSPAGAAIDAVGSPANIILTASLRDTNAMAVQPLNIPPASVTLTPVVAGLIPQFPVNYETKTMLTGSGAQWMDTSVLVSQTGAIRATTITANAVQLAGYHGCVSLFFYDQNGLAQNPPNAFWHTTPQRFGIDGASLGGGGSRTDTWTDQISPAMAVNLLGGGALYIVHYLCPNSALQDFNNWISPAQSVVNLYTSIYGSKTSGAASSASSK